MPDDGRFDDSLEPAESTSRRKRSGGVEWKSSKLLARSAEPLRGFTPSSLPDDRMAIHVVDVGQADAFLLEFPCAAALIDTGLEYSGGSDSKERLRAYLQWFFDERRADLDSTLDLVVISHPHADHANGVPVLLDGRPGGLSLKIRNVLDSGYDLKGAGEKQQRLRAAAEHSQSVSVAQIEWYSGATSNVIDPIEACDRSPIDPDIRVLWGSWLDINGANSNPNHHSVVVRVDFGQTTLLFTGDLQTGEAEGSGGLEMMLSDYAEDLSAFDVDVLKVAHHGAANGTTDALLRATSPCLAIMGVGDPDRRGPGTADDHGHPRMVTLDRLQDATFGVSGVRPHANVAAFPAHEEPYQLMDVDAAIYGTAWDGSLAVFASPNKEFWIETERGPSRHAVNCPK